MTEDFLSFKLPEPFIEGYASKDPKWGLSIGGGNSMSELTFISKYSRLKEDGTKERWHETCRRCIEGMYSILKDHCLSQGTYWNHNKGQKSAQEAYDRMFAFKWTPPGRGLWAMGTHLVNGEKNSAPAFNCAFLSTATLSSHSVYAATLPFVRLMGMCMYGIGVGFDTEGVGNLTIHSPKDSNSIIHKVGDSREGWCDALEAILTSYFLPNRAKVDFDYSDVRPGGSPLKRFGGYASGYGPLDDLFEKIREIFSGRDGEKITSMDILDIMNLIGRCVVAGSSRRSALIAIGSPDDLDFMHSKDWRTNPERMGIQVDEVGDAVMDGAWPVYSEDGGWGNLSNNSLNFDPLKMDEIDESVFESIALNGEPGLVNLGAFQDFGRMNGSQSEVPINKKATGVNPCVEVGLESHELCCLVEVYLPRHESKDDFLRTLKFAYLYGKVVNLLNTPWTETNEVITRNRRIGTGITGIVEFVEREGVHTLTDWSEDGYAELAARDEEYSSWLGIRNSIRYSAVKPSGTTSIIAATTPGVHWPVSSGNYIRRQRFAIHNPLVKVFKDAGYKVESDVMAPKTTVVVDFPVTSPDVRDERSVSIWEKAALAAKVQRYWADNGVSVTITFLPSEKDQVPAVIKMYGDQLKAFSFLPLDTGTYAQMPYEVVPDEEWQAAFDKVKPISDADLYLGAGAQETEAEKFCDTDVCII